MVDEHSPAILSFHSYVKYLCVSRNVPGADDPLNKRDGRFVFRVAILEGAREERRWALGHCR